MKIKRMELLQLAYEGATSKFWKYSKIFEESEYMDKTYGDLSHEYFEKAMELQDMIKKQYLKDNRDRNYDL